MLIGRVPDGVWRSLLTEKPRRMNAEALRNIVDRRRTRGGGS